MASAMVKPMNDNTSSGKTFNVQLLSTWDFLKLPLFAFITTFAVLYLCTIQFNVFPWFMENYRSSLRGSFFTGFMSLGSLLWAVKSFVISNLKKDYFERQLEDPNFIKDMKWLQDSTNGNIDFSIYFYPLVNLSRALFISVVVSLLTSVIQITIGSAKCIYATLFACSSISFALFMLGHTLYYVNINYQDWMTESTKEYKKEILRKIKEGNSESR